MDQTLNESDGLLEARSRARSLRLAKTAAEKSGADAEVLRGLHEDIARAEADLARIEAEHSGAGGVAGADLDGPLRRLLGRYENLVSVYGDLTVEGKSTRTRRRLSTAAANLLELATQVYPDGQFSGDAEHQNSSRVHTFGDLFRLVRESGQRLALIGDPGSGKSTTLTRLLFEYAKQALDDRTSPAPVLVDLASMTEDSQGFEEARTAASLSQYGVVLATTRSITLVDGLNETSPQTVESIVRWLAEHPTAPIVVACRKIDYVDRTLPLRRIDILPLNVGQIWEIIGNYFPDGEDQHDLFWGLAGAETQSLWRWFLKSQHQLPTFENFWFGDVGKVYSYEVEKTALARLQHAVRTERELPGILEVVRNPFLLSLAALTFAAKEELPDSRSELLRSFVETMVQRTSWTGTGLTDRQYRPGQLDQSEPMRLLTNLAFSMTSRGFDTSVPLDVVIVNLESEGVSGAKVTELMKRTGLADVQPGLSQRFRFRHQLFQEYLASRGLTAAWLEDRDPAEFWNPITWWETTPWDEVAVLAASALDDASGFVQWIARCNPSLAYRCAVSAGVRVDDHSFSLLFEPQAALACPRARAEWGRRLAVDGDSRPGVGLAADGTPDISWVRVPEGTYTIGGGDDGLKELGLYVKECSVEIPHHFFMARYPITYGQFAPFLRDGYQERQFWTDDGWAWRGDQTAPSMWEDSRFALPNHPLVGVSWFEAYAYTRWLTSITPRCSGGFWEISLPTEAEWEVSARYPDGRVFPWGDEFRPGLANIDETSEDCPVGPFFINRTTAVGMYDWARSDLGLMDLCGNVWEWCLSKWDTDYRFPEDVDTAGTSHRAVRGNSWYNSHRFSPCSAHDCEDPGFGMKDVGFRLVMRRTSPVDHKGRGSA